jgi:proline iminopeptidase
MATRTETTDLEQELAALLEVERFEPGPLREFEATPFDLRPELGRIAARTLVLTGRGDFICGPAAAGPLAAGIPGAELVVLEDAGHFTYLEQPERFRAIVEAFLAR